MAADSQITCISNNTLSSLFTLIVGLMNQQTPADINSPNSLRDGAHYDFIIVGAGAAGCVLANRLTERPDWNVLLLEAGGEQAPLADVPAYKAYTWETRLDWGYMSVPQPTACAGQPCHFTRGKALGGSTSINAMVYNRGNRYDYDHWKELGNEGWDYDNVLPYFKKSENNLDRKIAADSPYHGVGGYLNVGRFPYQDENVRALHKGFDELGYRTTDVNARHVQGVMLSQMTQKNGQRGGTNNAFLKPIRNRPNLHVYTNVRATKILINQDNNTAYGIEYAFELQRNNTGRVFADKEVILSAGTINTPQLLMLSGIGPEEVLGPLGIPIISDLKVGYNLQDHVGSTALRYLLSSKTDTEVSDEQIRRDMKLYNRTRRAGPLASTGIGQMTAFTNSRYGNVSIDYPDIQFLFRPTTSLVCTNPQIRGAGYYSAFAAIPVVTSPRSRGRVTINSTDPFEHPLIYPNYFTDEENHDMNVLIDALDEASRLVNTTAFKSKGITLDTIPGPGCENFEFGTVAYWQCSASQYTNTFYHYCGTCKMGSQNDTGAVVDSNLNVRGVSKLRIIDASVMPTIVRGTIMAPVIMIAEKGADLVKSDWPARVQQ